MGCSNIKFLLLRMHHSTWTSWELSPGREPPWLLTTLNFRTALRRQRQHRERVLPVKSSVKTKCVSVLSFCAIQSTTAATNRTNHKTIAVNLKSITATLSRIRCPKPHAIGPRSLTQVQMLCGSLRPRSQQAITWPG